MELLFKGIDMEGEEILPAWAYSKQEIKTLLDQYLDSVEPFTLHIEVVGL